MKRAWTTGGAEIDGAYRYRLWRVWDYSLPRAVFVMLNPSTADAEQDDPTIRRCIGFAARENCGSLTVVNLYPYRATDPAELNTAAANIYGPSGRNEEAIEVECRGAKVVIGGWGAERHRTPARQMAVIAATKENDLMCLGMTKGGAPRHPLYLRADAPLILYMASAAERAK